MKRNLFTLCVFILLALAVILVIKSKNRLRRTAAPVSTGIQQNGSLSVEMPQPANPPVFIATLPTTNITTNRQAKP